MPAHSHPAQSSYSLQELTAITGVTPRTVRYYVSEGLLPPPVAAGPRSYYTENHLQRLRLIVHLKDAYLPLREIRRRLQELSDDDIAGASAELEQSAPAPEAVPQTLLHRDIREEHFSIEPAVSEPAEPASEPSSDALQPQTWPFVDTPPQSPHDPVRPEPAWRLPRPVRAASTDMQRGTIWRKLEIGESAEFLIEERLYQRRKEQIDALIAWAQRILETHS
jgi:DNA-binding transcriptional MerR regulator